MEGGGDEVFGTKQFVWTAAKTIQRTFQQWTCFDRRPFSIYFLIFLNNLEHSFVLLFLDKNDLNLTLKWFLNTRILASNKKNPIKNFNKKYLTCSNLWQLSHRETFGLVEGKRNNVYIVLQKNFQVSKREISKLFVNHHH